MSKRYKLLKDLPDGGRVGDEYEKAVNWYYNTRIYKEATAIDEGHRWETWQVENNPEWWQLIPEETKKETDKERGFLETLTKNKEYFVKHKDFETASLWRFVERAFSTYLKQQPTNERKGVYISLEELDNIGINRNGYETGHPALSSEQPYMKEVIVAGVKYMNPEEVIAIKKEAFEAARDIEKFLTDVKYPTFEDYLKSINQ